MASLWKHPKSNFWTACFTDETGRRRKRSTKKLKRSEAQKIADTWEEAYQRKISRGQAQRVLSELFDAGGQAETTVEKFARAWLDELKPSVSPSTFSVYSNGINHFLASMGERAASCVLRIDLTFRIQNKIIPGGGVSMLQPVCACLGAACPPFDRSDLGTPRPPPCGWRCCPRNSQAFFFAAAARLVLADSSLINRAPSSSSLAHPS